MYVGHTSPDGRMQPLREHLEEVAALCQEFGSAFGAGEVARIIGLCHDIGKYSTPVQRRLLENGPKVDHSTAGGIESNKIIGRPGAYCVLGHHGGLPDGGTMADTTGEASMYGRLRRRPGTDIPDYSAFRKEITLSMPGEPALRPLEQYGFSFSMLVRMLFSCLVDADFLNTEAFMTNGAVQRSAYTDISTLCDRLDSYRKTFSNPTTDLNRKRSEILERCIAASEYDKGLYSLTVPTGGGKTISSLAFALKHVKLHTMARVIYVIPYTSIIEQNAAVFSNIVGAENVLEHHSGFDYTNDLDTEAGARRYLSTENWDAPLIVTTNVQFFESLFAARTSKCRKLHNIANSVIVFDEAQMLPLPYLRACVRSIAELVHNFGCTAVLCTATQPALNSFFPPEVKCTELCDSPKELYEFFRRATIQSIGLLSDDALAERLNGQKQVLCIVNTRKQAQVLSSMLEEEGNFHLTTLLYPEHRKAILAEIRRRLDLGMPCRVVATSLIEAGVDVDFPTVYRAKAGLDSLIQAAGRCNREGKNSKEESMVYLFQPEAKYALPMTQRPPAAALDIIAPQHSEDLSSPDAIEDYFTTLYHLKGGPKGKALDIHEIVSRLEAGYRNGLSFPFKAIADEFKLIETNTHAVLIPNTPESAAYGARLRQGERSRALLRDIGRYSVNVYDNHYRELCSMGIIQPLDTEIAVLADLSSYSPQTGLTLTPEGGKGIFVE